MMGRTFGKIRRKGSWEAQKYFGSLSDAVACISYRPECSSCDGAAVFYPSVTAQGMNSPSELICCGIIACVLMKICGR
jgi:hypothetical protein